MKYRITLNDDDYIDFNVFYLYNSRGGKRSVRTAQLALPVICILLILVMHMAVVDISFEFFLGELAFVVILSLIYYFRVPKLMENSVRKSIESMKKNGKLPYHAWAEIEFQESEIVEQYEQGVFRLKYEDIENIYLENESIYIFYTAVQAFIIPYRCLGADKESVIEYLMEKRG